MTLGFGRYAGRQVSELPTRYLRNVALTTQDAAVRAAIAQELHRRGETLVRHYEVDYRRGADGTWQRPLRGAMKRRPRCTAPEHVGSPRAARGQMFDGRHTYFICQTCFDVREREAERIRIRVAERLAPRLVPTGPRLVKTATATQ